MNYLFDKEKLKFLTNLHSQAEEKIKSAEAIDQRLSISSINELRLASKNLIDLLSSTSKEQQNKALDEAIQCCQRVIINVLQAEIIRYIGEIQLFNSEYHEIFDDLPGFDQIEFNKMNRRVDVADLFVKKLLNDSLSSWEFYD